RRDEARPIVEHRLRDRELPRIEVGARVRRCTRDDAVEVVRVPLRFGKTLASAGGTPVPVRALRRATVIAIDDRLGRDRHLVLRSIREIDELLRMTECE